MSKCDVVIEFDQPDGLFTAGQELTGSVVLTPTDNLDVKEVVIEQVWQTHGRGNPDTGSLDRQVGDGRRCVAGQSYAFPFRFGIPSHPVSYHGTLINVDHYITVRADVAWKRDPTAKKDYLVVPGRGSHEAAIAAHLGEEDGNRKAKKKSSPLLWVFAPLVVLLVAMVVVLLVVVLPIILCVALIRLIRRMAAERKLGKVSVIVDAELVDKKERARKAGAQRGMLAGLRERFQGLKTLTYAVAPGQTVPVSISFRPRSSVDINRVTLVLRATEKATSGSGTNAHTHTEILVNDEMQLRGPKRLAPGKQIEIHSEFALPETDAWTFNASSNKIEWGMRLCVDIAHNPDWVQDYTLIVVPPDYSPEAAGEYSNDLQ